MSGTKPPSRAELLAVIAEQSAKLAEQASVISQLTRENRELRTLVEELRARLDGGAAPPGVGSKKPPHWVKANRAKPEEPKPRKPRSEAFVRPREEPTQIMEVGVDQCPECGRGLSGGELVSSEQIVEIPQVRYDVIEIRRYRRWCGVCQKRFAPPPSPPDLRPKEGRFGPRLMSLVAELVTMGRMSHRGVRSLLQAQYGLAVSDGSIVSMLHRVAEAGREAYETLLQAVRTSPVVHADETGWREDGQNGQLWTLTTDSIRFYHRDPSRARHVIERLLGPEFSSILVTDFYSAYRSLDCPHQWCWTHLLRNVTEFKGSRLEDQDLARWVGRLHEFWYKAKGLSNRVRDGTEKQRLRAREQAEAQLRRLASQKVALTGAGSVFGKRIRECAGELVTFVEHPAVPSDNNPAERALRPAVINRKTCGGTRSARGSVTKMTLLTCFLTWTLRGQNPLEQCYRLLNLQPTF